MPIDMTCQCNPTPHQCTLCSRIDGTNPLNEGNIWLVAKAPGYPPRCILDELSFEQVYDVLRRVPRARADLLVVTEDPDLITLANETMLVSDEIEQDQAATKRLNANTLPFYTVFKGNMNGDIIK